MAASSSRLRVGYRFDPRELPVGYRFHPTEEELVGYFLKKKIQGHDFDDVIPEIDICNYEPWDLPELSPMRPDDEEWFYFSRPEYKSGKKGGRTNRTTRRGFWKITAKQPEIKARESRAVIGKKRIMTFYTGKARNEQRTSWGIHEYYIPETLLPNAARQRDFVLCRLKKKDESTNIGAYDEGEPSTNNASDFQNLMEVFGRQSIPEITLQENTRRPEEIFDTLFPSLESPQLHNFSSMLGDNFLHANAVSDDHLELQSAFRHDDSEDEEFNVNSYLVDDGDYSLEETSRTTRLNHSSEPKSVLKVYDEGIHQQSMSSPVASSLPIRDTNVMLLKFSQKNASPVNVAANLPRKELQADFGNDMLLRTLVTDKSSLNESGRRKGGIFITERAEKQSGPAAFPHQPDDYITQRRMRLATAQSDASSIKQGHNPQKVKNESKLPEKPMAPPSNDKEESMKQKQTGTTISDWKSSFIVWKESPLSLRSYPPVVYTCYMIVGLILFIFFVGELISYGKWY
ncbi:protein BEARSKIN1-like isoform X2 [Rosa rugosa]|uniref:protein BEARSKIN1-like isoform X2 n=1 Tax=Rosa rugosa TaxID=74645 RepID=UPI002B41804A|nr:protein BEARSKIN1-like isoform X2 [Rosa rugosa]